MTIVVILYKTIEAAITQFPSDTTIIEGEGVYTMIKVSGEPRPTVTWYHDGELIREDYVHKIDADRSLVIPSAELKYYGTYKVVVANQHGSEEKEVRLTINNREIGAEMVSSRPIPILESAKYVAELHANSNQPFKQVYS